MSIYTPIESDIHHIFALYRCFKICNFITSLLVFNIFENNSTIQIILTLISFVFLFTHPSCIISVPIHIIENDLTQE